MNTPCIFVSLYSGGGLGGLIAARAISEFVGLDKVELDVYEATTKMTEIGAGIVIWPRTWELLKRIGLEERLTKLLPAPPTSDPGEDLYPGNVNRGGKETVAQQ